MRHLDRSFFKKKIEIAAACVLDRTKIAACQRKLSQDILRLDRLPPVRSLPPHLVGFEKNARCLLLKPEIRHGADNESSWSPQLKELKDANEVAVVRYELELNYDYWNYHDIMTAILPDSEQSEIPVGFSAVGHVAHLNLRSQYLPYKHLIASVLLDKNPTIRTVINKIDDVGEENEFRTFKYEVLAGPDDMKVEVREQECLFRFDYSKVYWNTRLSTEHHRLVSKFKPGEAVCDVMAGVGPFALPAAKKGVWVWANDLNPDSYSSLVDNAKRNKVSHLIRPFCSDGHTFIQAATSQLLSSSSSAATSPDPALSHTKNPPSRRPPRNRPPPPSSSPPPKTFAHYILNLPATATSFLPSFIGLYAAHHQNLFDPASGDSTKLPMIHVYCFSTKSDDNAAEKVKICREVSELLGYEIGGSDEEEEGVEVWDVRDVAPQKRMFCASFRLSREVAFRTTGG